MVRAGFCHVLCHLHRHAAVDRPAEGRDALARLAGTNTVDRRLRSALRSDSVSCRLHDRHAARVGGLLDDCRVPDRIGIDHPDGHFWRSEEHTSELQSLMRISYAVFCLKKKYKKNNLL